MTKAYLLGALHDGTVRKKTYRIGAKDYSYAVFIKLGISMMGSGAWIYREGAARNYYIVEFVRNVLDKARVTSRKEKIEYIRGYFDTDGGIAKSRNVRYYIYFAQRDKKDLHDLKKYLEELDIHSGVMHNPSKKKDSNYWRFFIRADSYAKFATTIGSSHPVKSQYIRVKI